MKKFSFTFVVFLTSFFVKLTAGAAGPTVDQSNCFAELRRPQQSVHDYVFDGFRHRLKLQIFLDKALSCSDLQMIKDAAPSVVAFHQLRYGLEDFQDNHFLDLEKYRFYSTTLGFERAKEVRLPSIETAIGEKTKYRRVVVPWDIVHWKVVSSTEITVERGYGRVIDTKTTFVGRLRFRKIANKWLFDGFEQPISQPEIIK